jgi:hypothetical protein
MLSSVACPSLQYSSTLYQKLHDFRELNIVVHQTCVAIFSTTLSETCVRYLIVADNLNVTITLESPGIFFLWLITYEVIVTESW